MQTFIVVVFLSIVGAGLAILLVKLIKRFEDQQGQTNVRLLISACFGDEPKALKLINEEKRKDPTLNDEAAAARALDALLANDKFKHHTDIDFYI